MHLSLRFYVEINREILPPPPPRRVGIPHRIKERRFRSPHSNLTNIQIEISVWRLRTEARLQYPIFVDRSTRAVILVFSAPEPKAQVHYCDHALSVVRRSSVRIRPSLTFSISTSSLKRNSMKLDKKQDPLPSLCFWADRKKQDGRPGFWLAETFSTSSLKPLNGIQWNLTGSKILTSSTKFVFWGRSEKTRWPPWPLIGWDIFDFSSKTAERNSTKLDRKQDLNVLYRVCVFGPIGKTRWPPGLWLVETHAVWHLII